MVSVIELQISDSGDARETEHEHIQARIESTWRVYKEMLEECRQLGFSFKVHAILDRMGCVVADVEPGMEQRLRSLNCVKDVRESRVHKQLTRQ